MRFGLPVSWRLRRMWRKAPPDAAYIATQGPLGYAALTAARTVGVPSLTETFGNVVLEAMALGVPVVSTAVMGTKEVLEGGKGCLIAADYEADFAAKAVRLLADPNLRATLGEQARVYARSWSAPELADRMLELYQTLV